MVRRTRAWRWLLAPIALLLMAESALAATTARADRTTLSLNESFQVVFETDQDISGTPDFSPLDEDFGSLGTSRSTSINVINGQMQRSISWVVDLMPKRTGTLIVPALEIGRENSNVIEIDVRPASAAGAAGPADDVMLEATVDNPSPYVQGQIILTIRFLRSVPIGNASLTEPQVTGGDVLIEQLGDDVGYETERDGTRMAVVERRYAIFAQNSGSLVIEPLVFEGRVTENRRFGFDPFSRGRIVRARSHAIEIDVKPVPATFTGTAWLPAEQLMLVEKAPDGQDEYRLGEPITRTLTLQAAGLTSSQLPEIDAPVGPGIKQYPDQPLLENRSSSDGITAVRQEKVALIPSESGMLTLPAISIPWWNTRTDQLEYARLPERTIDVLPATGTATASAALLSPPADVPDATAADAGSDGPARSAVPGLAGYWPWLSLALAVGWVATLLGWRFSRRRTAIKITEERARPSDKALAIAIRQACDANDACGVKDALLAWASYLWPGSRVRSLGELAARLDGDLQHQIHQLSRYLYRADESHWDGACLWQAFAARQPGRSAAAAKLRPALEPLYLK